MSVQIDYMFTLPGSYFRCETRGAMLSMQGWRDIWLSMAV